MRKKVASGGDGAVGDGQGDTSFGAGGGDGGASPLATDDRTMDQLRADILADMLLTSQPWHGPTRADGGPGTLGAIRATVQVVVPALSLLGTIDDAGDLVGRSPIDPALAAQLAGATPVPWTRVITDPVTGAVLYTDTYTRNRAIDRYLKARTGTAGSPAAAARRSAATWTTPSTGPRADPPTLAICAASAKRTTL
jgi:hypothetical protein